MNPNIKYLSEPYGKCPVQAEGTINGLKFYFRSRGRYMRLLVALVSDKDPLTCKDEENWLRIKKYNGVNYDRSEFCAGYAEVDECKGFIEESAKMILENCLPPSAWEIIFGIKILDPDGWRKDDTALNVWISEKEFIDRILISTIKGKIEKPS